MKHSVFAVLAMALASLISPGDISRTVFAVLSVLFAVPSFIWIVMSVVDSIQSRNDHVSRLLCAMSSWSWEVDSSGRFIEVSSGVISLGMYSDRLRGRLFYEMCDTPNSCAEQFAIAVRSGMNMNIGMTVTVRGSKKYLQMIGVPVFSRGVFSGYRGVCVDSTDERMTYDRMLYFQKMESIGTICAGITHDLKNMAQIISVNSYLLKNRLKDERDYKDFREYLESVDVSSTNLKNVLQKMMTIFSGTAGGDSCSFAFDSFMESKVIPMFITPSNIKLHVSLQCGGAAVYGSPTQLMQMVLNLFINAYQSIEKTGDVGICSYVKEKYVVLEISDTGCGMTDEQMRRAFEAFYTCRQNSSGTGLGLFMVHEIAKNHGGYVDVSSKIGHGTVFSVYIPKCGA